KAIEAAKQAAEQKAKQDERLEKAEERAEMLLPPEIKQEEQRVTTSFKVRGTMAQLKALKAFIVENNIEIIGG
ncbi:MAG: hypothetical protein II306_11335, partial [Clostridia bacterium]|nr:hypothetical protein [Clostridia bacterium]